MPHPHAPPVDPRGVLAREWAAFARRVLDPINAGQVQRTEMRRAWYAGAATMFDTITNLAGPNDEDDAVGAARVEQVHQELRRFGEALKAGRA
jgi:hypothetical protein